VLGDKRPFERMISFFIHTITDYRNFYVLKKYNLYSVMTFVMININVLSCF
jgi:hypothetical protein